MKGVYSAHPWHSMNDFNLDYSANLYKQNSDLFVEVKQQEIRDKDQTTNESTQVFISKNKGKNWQKHEDKFIKDEAEILYSI